MHGPSTTKPLPCGQGVLGSGLGEQPHSQQPPQAPCTPLPDLGHRGDPSPQSSPRGLGHFAPPAPELRGAARSFRLCSPQPPGLLIYSPPHARANSSPGTSQPKPSPEPCILGFGPCCSAAARALQGKSYLTSPRSTSCSATEASSSTTALLPADRGLVRSSGSQPSPRDATGGLHGQERPGEQGLAPAARFRGGSLALQGCWGRQGAARGQLLAGKLILCGS